MGEVAERGVQLPKSLLLTAWFFLTHSQYQAMTLPLIIIGLFILAALKQILNQMQMLFQGSHNKTYVLKYEVSFGIIFRAISQLFSTGQVEFG